MLDLDEGSEIEGREIKIMQVTSQGAALTCQAIKMVGDLCSGSSMLESYAPYCGFCSFIFQIIISILGKLFTQRCNYALDL